jgi:hypothetical protein
MVIIAAGYSTSSCREWKHFADDKVLVVTTDMEQQLIGVLIDSSSTFEKTTFEEKSYTF